MLEPEDASIVLNRMEIEEVGFNPERLAQAVHHQLDSKAGPVPVTAIAAALDIHDIRYEPLESFEGALVMSPSRSKGAILVNSLVSTKRQRFTIAHELGHYLNLRHVPASDQGFECTRVDMKLWGASSDLSTNQRQELEANRFAIELLAPRKRLAPILRQPPNLIHIAKLSDELHLSKEATARRYIELSDDPIAIALSQNARCRYLVKSVSCPAISLRGKQAMPFLPGQDNGLYPSNFHDADADDWLYQAYNKGVQIQTLWQRDGHCMTLIILEDPLPDGSEDEPDDGIEDTLERFSRF